MPTTFHIRARLPRKGGNQWRKSQAVRTAATLCGAPVTDYDAAWHHTAKAWHNQAGAEYAPCSQCVQLKAQQQPAPRRRVRVNIWGNWNGYEGRVRVQEFGTDEIGARQWVETGKTQWQLYGGQTTLKITPKQSTDA